MPIRHPIGNLGSAAGYRKSVDSEERSRVEKRVGESWVLDEITSSTHPAYIHLEGFRKPRRLAPHPVPDSGASGWGWRSYICSNFWLMPKLLGWALLTWGMSEGQWLSTGCTERPGQGLVLGPPATLTSHSIRASLKLFRWLSCVAKVRKY